MRARAALLALLLGGGALGAQTPVVRLEDAGRGRGPAILRAALSAPHRLIVGRDTAQVVLPRDSVYTQTVIVLARETVIDGTVRGDLIAVGGDLHIHPRAVITGRAIAIGGGVYESTMSRVGAGTEAFRDFTYEIRPVSDGYALRYRSFIDRPMAAITWPGIYGLRLPTYDRTNGLSLTAGPVVAVPGTSLLVEPRVSYRSQLGQFDPALGVTYGFTSMTSLVLSGERNTFSNEEWIWPNLVNSAATLVAGKDTRNYYRGRRFEGLIDHRLDLETVDAALYVGARYERDESVRPDSNATGGPWSLRGRNSVKAMLRPNPRVENGRIASLVAGARGRWMTPELEARATLDLEAGTWARPLLSGPRVFSQATFDGSIQFLTYRTQSLRIDGHFVASASDYIGGGGLVPPGTPLPEPSDPRTDVPRQRWAYLGGTGSVPTLELLERGGDQLVFIDARYDIPFERVVLPMNTIPIITLREILAGADVGKFPSIAQVMGVRLTAMRLYVEYMFNPDSKKGRFAGGFAFAR